MSETIIYQNPGDTPPTNHISPQKYRLRTLTLALTLALIVTLLFLFAIRHLLSAKYSLLSPLADHIPFLHQPQLEKPNKIVLGFLPYWNFKLVDTLPYEYLTDMALFGIAVNKDGTFQTREANYTEPGWRWMNGQTSQKIIQKNQLTGTKNTLVLRAFDDDIIESIISKPDHTNTLIQEINTYLKDHPYYTSLNIDFEYQGQVAKNLQSDFTSFVSNLSSSLSTLHSPLTTSIDVYADAIEGDRIWDIPELSPYIDYFVIMAYDFYRPGSNQAGPVAPVYGAPQLWKKSITSLLTQHLETTPPQKLILGIPLYGYQWPTKTQEFLSPTTATGYLATIERVEKYLQANPSTTINWHDQSLTPWISFEEKPGVFSQIHYENQASIGYKIDLARQTNLAGIAFWAIGYEGENNLEFWNSIYQKLKQD